MHLSEISRSLKESITLRKTIDRLSKNLNAFDDKDSLMHNYLSLVKHNVKDDYAVIIIDNSDIPKPASRKPEALSEIRDAVPVRSHRDIFPLKQLYCPRRERCRFFLKRGGVSSSVPKRTGMLFIAGKPATSWMWRYSIRGLTAWILK